jgi:tRNA G18 (ribose-2'-O)-methylase SpoU
MSAHGPIIPIEDANDERVLEYRDLNDSVVSRRMEADGALFVVEGRVAVGQLLRSAYSVRSLLVDDHQLTLAASLVEGVQAQGAPVFVAPRSVVAGTIGFDLHRGVVALANRPAPLDPSVVMDRARGEDPSVTLAVLEDLNDHENIGSLFRNAAAFGVAGLLLSPSCADPLYRRSIRVSVGHVLHVPFARATAWPVALHDLRKGGFLVVALVPNPEAGWAGAGEAISLAQLVERLARRAQPVAVLLGAEGPGLSAAAMEAADLLVTIPMAAGVDSLNVATAAAIAFHRIAELRTA